MFQRITRVCAPRMLARGHGSRGVPGRGGVHDHGGTASSAPIAGAGLPDRPLQFWERRMDACAVLLGAKALVTVDEMRRGIESLEAGARGAGRYDALSYYERWAASIADNMVRNGHITLDELARKMSKIEKRILNLI